MYQTGWVRSSGAFWAAGRMRPGLVCVCVACMSVPLRVRVNGRVWRRGLLCGRVTSQGWVRACP